jgi:hypothetical protein
MKLHTQDQKKISDSFDSLKTIPDFIELLNFVYQVLYKEAKYPFKHSTVSYYAFHFSDRYFSFEILKKNGKPRNINAPKGYLKLIQQCINVILQIKFTPHYNSHGFLLNKNIVSNAKLHTGKNFVLNIDLKDFFESIKFRRVKTVLGLPPFDLINEREDIAFLIANICCNNDFLPQGAPTSPILTNIICKRLDKKLTLFAKENKITYSRYADDITFSSLNDVFNDAFITELKSIITNEKFELNESKTRIQNWKQRQEVTGLTVNKKVNVNREYIRRIRAIFNNYEKKGPAIAQNIFNKHWSDNAKNPPSFQQSLKGQIDFLKMVRGGQDEIYQKFKLKYLSLFSDGFIDYSFVNVLHVKKSLEKDQKRMESIGLIPGLSADDKFIDYCIYSFLQIEELINYYFTSSMNIETLLNELEAHTYFKRNKSEPQINISQIDSVYKIYLFEMYFYYKGIFYDKILNKIRLVRNEGLHRCSVIVKDEENILNEYQKLTIKIAEFEKINPTTKYKMSRYERHLEQESKLIPFLKEKNFSSVRKALQSVAENIRISLNSQHEYRS